ncbi:hypothetical protein CN556_24825 [Bacillus wiedmannii]|uniref:cold-shock protein n=1 Tax=Bacillus wiedmannii TaxID=1890302 RepID=UPI000BEC9D88|nr:cold shock domain-containing protein [Bacillus wiedmannii]PEC58450.1 hypothetical protein CON91_27985 [Bacillus wiedmannii]PEI34221.1 hypothetical protein CN644_18405 [Bacillus wiedmannii]PEN91880.1 hypothetical protein CN556_24825 [Bacillus wiedmannii]
MKGRVTKYFDEKGYGFVKDERGSNRFFHISKVISMEEITQGSFVEFTPEENEKGLTCVGITVLTKNKPKFIALGEERIKLSNIKNYGIDHEIIEEVISEETIYLSTGGKAVRRVGGVLLGIAQAADHGLAGFFDGISKVNMGNSYTKQHLEDVKYPILYVTTYQENNFRFHQKYVDFDVQKKFDELDKLFCY